MFTGMLTSGASGLESKGLNLRHDTPATCVNVVSYMGSDRADGIALLVVELILLRVMLARV